MSNKNEVFEYLIDQLRQQVSNNLYKQQCEDPAHEVLSLKNRLRDAWALVAELQEDNIKESEHISHLTGQVKELHLALATATGDVEAYKLIRKGGGISGDPTPSKPLPGCINCGATKAEECEHVWYRYNLGGYTKMCVKCGLKK